MSARTEVVLPGTITSPVIDTGTEVEERDDDFSGYYCIATAPWPCPAESCGFVANHITAAHLIVVWPDIDDQTLLAQARNARELGRNPKVIEYQSEMGPAISYGAWLAAGKPVHALAAKPDGYDGWRKL